MTWWSVCETGWLTFWQRNLQSVSCLRSARVSVWVVNSSLGPRTKTESLQLKQKHQMSRMLFRTTEPSPQQSRSDPSDYHLLRNWKSYPCDYDYLMPGWGKMDDFYFKWHRQFQWQMLRVSRFREIELGKKQNHDCVLLPCTETIDYRL